MFFCFEKLVVVVKYVAFAHAYLMTLRHCFFKLGVNLEHALRFEGFLMDACHEGDAQQIKRVTNILVFCDVLKPL